MASDWLAFNPHALYWTPKLLHEIWGTSSIFITENGCSCDDTTIEKGKVMDTDRILYLRTYLEQMLRATDEGVTIKGYFAWSLLDNFEWGAGLDKRFGLVHVDFETLRRTPKLSFDFYRDFIQGNPL